MTLFYPRQLGSGRLPRLAFPLRLVATDIGSAPVRVLGGPGPVAGEVPLRVSGPAEGLALLLWGRTTVEEAGLTVAGNRADLDALLREPFVP